MLTLKQKIRPWFYRLKHQLLTPRNLLVILAGVLALSWVVSAVLAMEQNYNLQKRVDKRRQQLAVLKLETESLEIEKEYYKSAEYQDLAVRKSLGLGASGEKLLVLPPYTDWVRQKQAEQVTKQALAPPKISNFNQWINFLLGGNRKARR
jgi:hypothetical protein